MTTTMDRTEDQTVEAQAAALRSAAATRIAIAPLRHAAADASEAVAYAIQEAGTRAALAAGRRLVGRKIGLTARTVQRQLGVHQPDYGMLFADMAFGDEEPLPQLIQPRVEAEVALVMAREVADPQTTVVDLLRAVDHAQCAIEVVDSRIRDWDIGFFDTVADNASAGAFVLSGRPVPLAGLDLHGCRMRMTRGEELVAEGEGRACLGHPLNAAVWLARRMAAVGRPLQAGDILLTGALGPMVAARPGDVIRAEIDGLGSVRACFGDPS